MFWVIDSPKSSSTAPLTKFQYWLGSELVEAELCRCSVAIAWGVACAPSTTLAGSPGTKWMSRNEAKVIPIRTGIAWTMRRRT